MSTNYKRVADVSLQQVDNNPLLFEFCKQATLKKLPAKSYIFAQHEHADSIYLLVSGTVTVVVTNNEQQLVLEHLTAPYIFGDIAYYSPQAIRLVSVIARSDVVVAQMSFTEFSVFREQHPGILDYLCKQSAQRLAESCAKISSMVFDNIIDRTLYALYQLTQLPDSIYDKTGIYIKISRQELANILGVSKETINRCIKILERYNFITCGRKQIKLNFAHDSASALCSGEELKQLHQELAKLCNAKNKRNTN